MIAAIFWSYLVNLRTHKSTWIGNSPGVPYLQIISPNNFQTNSLFLDVQYSQVFSKRLPSMLSHYHNIFLLQSISSFAIRKLQLLWTITHSRKTGSIREIGWETYQIVQLSYRKMHFSQKKIGKSNLPLTLLERHGWCGRNGPKRDLPDVITEAEPSNVHLMLRLGGARGLIYLVFIWHCLEYADLRTGRWWNSL